MKSGFVGLIGKPNVGKSTLMNKIIGQKIAITSNKSQTTRNNILSIYTTDSEQIVFIDTPGIHKINNKLDEFMNSSIKSAISDVDIITILVDDKTVIDDNMSETINKIEKPKILLINKTDKYTTEETAKLIKTFSDKITAAEIIPISAKTGYNVNTYIDILKKNLKEGVMFFDKDQVTNQTVGQIVAEIIREKGLHKLSFEVPHGIAVLVEDMKYDSKKNIYDISAVIVCEKSSHKKIIIGKNGAQIKEIGILSRYEIEKLVDCHVNLNLFVKVKANWRDSDFLIANYGYNKDEN